MDQQVVKVKEIHAQIFEAKKYLDELEHALTQEKTKLQDMCPHDHIDAIDDGDYHSKRYYYTCSLCGYWTRFKPYTYVTLQYK